MTQGIYCYIDKKTNKIVYVGKDSHIDTNKRHKQHCWGSSYNIQQINKVLQNNLDRYEYRILEEGDISQKVLNALEMCFIQKYNPKFNFTKGGDGLLGHKFSEEHRRKLSEALKGRQFSEEHRKKLSEAAKGKQFSEEHKKKISKALKGKHFSEETKKKMSEGRNTSGYYRVYKIKDRGCKQGFMWRYMWRENKKRKVLSSVDIKKLEEKVKEKGLPWFKIEKEG